MTRNRLGISCLLVAIATTLAIALPGGRSDVVAGVPASHPQMNRKFGEMIGLQVKFTQGQPEEELSTLKELGVRWVRDFVAWPEVEPVAGQYRDFPDSFLKRLAYYRENEIGVVLLLAYPNSVAYPPTATEPYRSVDPEAYGRYVAHAARLMRSSGVRFVLELWNEPHNTLRPLIGGMWNGMPPSPWVDHYVRMVHEAVKRVKAIDPTIKLLSDDDMWVLHYRFLEAGLPRDLDGFAFHPYGAPAPEIAAVDRYTEWVKPFVVVDDDRSFRSAVRLLRARGSAKLGRSPEMWVTEWGWAIGDKSGQGPVTEEILAGFIPRAFIGAAAAGVQVMCWFSAQDSVDGPMGLTTNDMRRRQSYHAFRTMSAQLAEYNLVRQLEGAKRPTAGVQAFLFRGDSDFKVVIWNIDAVQRRLVLKGPLENTRAIDAVGNDVIAVRASSGALFFPFASGPIYISGLAEGPRVRLEIE